MEQWRQAAFCFRYEISNHGNIRHFKHKRFLKPKPDRSGYLRIVLRNNVMKHVSVPIHKEVALAFVTNNGKPEINHIDSNKTNNHFTNLEWVTHQENMEHMHQNMRKMKVR